MPNHWRDPQFVYHGSQTHGNDSTAFRRRMRAYQKAVQEEAAREVAAVTAKVQPIKKAVAK